MRYTKLALLSTLSVCALLTATSSSAFAPSVTDLGLLRPQNVWQIGDINAKNASYCAMMGEFDKQISLAFARSPSGSGSLAIGFPSDVLDTGTEYQVTLQVDDLATRRYNVRAANARSLIVQIGRDEEFYGTMGNNGTLRISMPNMDMRFDLAKFSSSYMSLVSCTNRLPHHEGPRTAAVPVSPVEKENLLGRKKAETKIAAASSSTPVPLTSKAAARPELSGMTWTKGNANQNLLGELPSLTPADNAVAENMDLKSKLSQIGLEQTELTNSVNLLKSQKLELQAKLDMKEKQFQLLEAAMSAKDRDLASVRSVSNNDSQSLTQMQTELASLKRERDQAVADLQMKLTEKTAQYDTLQKQFTETAEARRTAQEKSMQAEAEVETLRQRLAQAQEQIASSDQQKSDLASQVEFQGQQSKTLLQRVQDQLSRATQQISLLESQLTAVAMQRDDLKTQVDAEMNKNKALAAHLEVKQRELAYRPPVSNAPVAISSGASVRDNNGMNLLGSARNLAIPAPLSAPSPLPTIARDDMVPPQSLLHGKVDAKTSSTSPSGDNWDTVVIQ